MHDSDGSDNNSATSLIEHLLLLDDELRQSVANGDERCRRVADNLKRSWAATIAEVAELLQLVDVLTTADKQRTGEFRRHLGEPDEELLRRLVPGISLDVLVRPKTKRAKGHTHAGQVAVELLLANPQWSMHCRDLIAQIRSKGVDVGTGTSAREVNRKAGILDMRLKEQIGRGAPIERIGPRLYRAVQQANAADIRSDATAQLVA
jgi:hypothetical protein